MGMVLASEPGFPNALVWLIPILCNIISKPDQGLLHFTVETPAMECELRRRVDHFTIDVELKLFARRVPDAHRTRFAISAQVLQFAFHRSLVAIQGI